MKIVKVRRPKLKITIRKKPKIIIRKRAPKITIYKPFTVEDLLRLGFEQTGRVMEAYDPAKICGFLRKWYMTSIPNEKTKWEGLMALGGWFRRPPSLQEILAKNGMLPTEARKTIRRGK